LYAHVDDTHYLLDATHDRTGDRAYFVKSPSVTNLVAKFQSDSTNLNNGQWLNRTSKPGGNNLELKWDAPVNTNIDHYIITETRPDGTSEDAWTGSKNVWLTAGSSAVGANDSALEFGVHGDGAYTYSVVAYNEDNGTATDPVSFVLNYDHT